MNLRACAIGLVVAGFAAEASALQVTNTAPGGGRTRAAGGQRRYHWSRYSSSAAPANPRHETAEELAPRFDLESLGPQGPDGTVHWRHRRTGMIFVFVPGGPFRMGSNHGEIFSNIQIADSAGRGGADPSYFDAEQPQALETVPAPGMDGNTDRSGSSLLCLHRLRCREHRRGGD
jgi:hypothetical protein